MDKYYNSVVTSSEKYLKDLEYLAKDNKKVLADLFDLQIFLNMYEWVSYQEYPEENKQRLEKMISIIILNNPDLKFVVDATLDYRNVNTPQTLWTWQRIYDNFLNKTINNA
jgi:hypothetical protein